VIYALHGTMGMAADWGQPLDKLGMDAGLIHAIDLWEYTGTSLREFAKRFNHVVRDKGCDENILLGYSMGARLALHVLLDDASLWRKAVIVSAHTGLVGKERMLRVKSDAVWAEKIRTERWVEVLREWNDQPIFKTRTQMGGDTDSNQDNTLCMGDRSLLESKKEMVAESFHQWSLGQQEDLLADLKKVNTPVLWFTGEEDLKFTDIAKLAVRELPSSRHAVVTGAGHRVPWENPCFFTQELLRFVKT